MIRGEAPKRDRKKRNPRRIYYQEVSLQHLRLLCTGDSGPAKCPVCRPPQNKLELIDEEKTRNAKHVIGIAKVDAITKIIQDLHKNFQGECTEIGMYLAMARVAYREGYPEIVLYREQAATQKPNMPPSLPNFWVKA